MGKHSDAVISATGDSDARGLDARDAVEILTGQRGDSA